ncbi:zinc finger protein 652-B isoform X1 [Strongylocentrotus purpuratus]|uniref:C2H2-type domain-containing protein n=1 Tax=Strongylocentrotus purpuratus TaxID=7668 RepID=A0A7M7HN13_STRPU|nr:zinc finger protein 652-B isoform X1 [Strongylocentrotus purpuratus]|eukprot:XP_011673788.1 PREDICTED: zinc finger protein 652-B isoform X1 [Strongylocentrotus purpuratus]
MHATYRRLVPNNNMEKEENTALKWALELTAGKKKMGRPALLSSSVKKERRSQRMKAYRARHKALWLDWEVHERWFALAKQLEIPTRDLAVMLLDAYAADGSNLSLGLGSDSEFLPMKKSVCVDQSTQTMPDVYSCSHCGSFPPTKPMSPLTRIQPSGPQHVRPSMTPQAFNSLMLIGSNLQAAQPLHGNLTGSSQLPARCVVQVPGQGLLTGQDIPGSTHVVKMEPVESMEGFEQLPNQEFSQAKCIDEKDNTEDYIYDDGSRTLDDGKEFHPDKKLSRVTDRPVTVFVKEEVMSDPEHSNSVHSDEESFFDPMRDQEFGSDSKLEHSETGWYEEEEEEKDKEEEEDNMEDEEQDEEDDMEDDEEIDYEEQELLDPTYDPSASMPQHSSKNGKDIPGSSRAKSSKCLGDQDSLESDDSFEYGGDSDEDVEGEPAKKRKKHQSKNRKPAFKFPEACPICSEAWKEKEKIMRHLQKHIPIDKGPEAIKDAVQSIKSKFEKEHNFDMGWCGECKKLLLRFRTHLNRCHNKNPRYGVLCQQCGKMIKSCNIKMHEISHLVIKESDYVQCPECPSRFKHQEYLKGHITDAHSNKIKSTQCPTCGKIMKNREHLRRHLLIHSGLKPYPCSVCDKSFTQSSNLKAHMRQHTGDKPYVCELCEMAFTNKVTLKNHKKKLHGIDWWKERESLKKEDPERNKSDGSE